MLCAENPPISSPDPAFSVHMPPVLHLKPRPVTWLLFLPLHTDLFGFCGEQKHKSAQDEVDALKPEAEKVGELESASAELQRKVYTAAAAAPWNGRFSDVFSRDFCFFGVGRACAVKFDEACIQEHSSFLSQFTYPK